MEDGKFFLSGSMCLNDIYDALNAKHSAFSKSEKNGKVYFNVKGWFSVEPDKIGQNLSILVNSRKDAPEEEKKKNLYIGNMKIQATGGSPLTDKDAENITKAIADAAGGLSASAPSSTHSATNVAQGQVPVIVGDGLPF